MFIGSFFSAETVYNFLVKHIPNYDSSTALLIGLLTVLVTGFIGGWLARKVRQPLFLGYIIAGVFAGAALDILIANSGTTINVLANIGVSLLLFSMGLEFDLKGILEHKSVAIAGTLLQVMFTLVCGVGIACWVSGRLPGELASVHSKVVFGAAFVSTSTAVVLKTLTSRRLMETMSSKVMIVMSIVQDLTVIPLFILACKFGALSQGGTLQDVLKNVSFPLALGFLYMVLMMTVGKRVFPRLLEWIAKKNVRELFILLLLLIALLSGVAAELAKLSFSFGAFLAGIALSSSVYSKKSISEMVPIRDLFQMIFFVSIGIMLDYKFLFGNWQLVLIVMVLTSLSRTLFLAIITWSKGYRNVIPFAMLFGMFPTSEIAFVLITLARGEGLFSEKICSLILCVVVVSMLAGPFVDGLTKPCYDFLQRKGFIRRLGNIKQTLPDLTGHVVIAGGGVIGARTAGFLKKKNLPFVLIEPGYNDFKKASAFLKENVIFGDPQQPSILEQAGITRASVLLAASAFADENKIVLEETKRLTARSNPRLSLITRADEMDDIQDFLDMKVDPDGIVHPKFEASLEMARQLLLNLQVSAVEIQKFLGDLRKEQFQSLLELKANTSEEREAEKSNLEYLRALVEQFEVTYCVISKDSPFAGKSIMESNIRGRTGVSVIGVVRPCEDLTMPNPPSDFVLQADDIVALSGTREQFINFEKNSGGVSSGSLLTLEDTSVSNV